MQSLLMQQSDNMIDCESVAAVQKKIIKENISNHTNRLVHVSMCFFFKVTLVVGYLLCALSLPNFVIHSFVFGGS
jgi:hypothetical protein